MYQETDSTVESVATSIVHDVAAFIEGDASFSLACFANSDNVKPDPAYLNLDFQDTVIRPSFM